MFGASQMSSDYTFTQTANLNTIQSAKVISKHFGESGVAEKTSAKSISKEAKTSDTANSESPNAVNSNVHVKKDHDEDYAIHLMGSGDNESESEDLSLEGTASASITSSFSALVQALGGVGNKISKVQLINYLQSLTANGEGSSMTSDEISFIKNLIARFDTLSGGSNYITSFEGTKEAQDYTTITKEQVTSPIDIRI